MQKGPAIAIVVVAILVVGYVCWRRYVALNPAPQGSASDAVRQTDLPPGVTPPAGATPPAAP